MTKCPYCLRPLRMGGLRCRACRRYVLRRSHILLLLLLAVALVVGVLEVVALIP
ncbi:MAG TPA: hypothetical protein VEX60_08230 [Pyrinomonadaceae bacterium]|nr:hypothetical protein [Pyrinomonadaceae bacterium]